MDRREVGACNSTLQGKVVLGMWLDWRHADAGVGIGMPALVKGSFKIPSLKFEVDLLSTGHLSRLFDSTTGSRKMRNHFPVISVLLILSQLPYRAKYFL